MIKNYFLAILSLFLILLLLAYQDKWKNLNLLNNSFFVFYENPHKMGSFEKKRQKKIAKQKKHDLIKQNDAFFNKKISSNKKLKNPIQKFDKKNSEITTRNFREIININYNKQIQPKLLYGKSPEYPQCAYENSIEGFVQVKLLVNEIGKVEKVEVLQGNNNFGFVDAVKKVVYFWQFQPIKINGKAKAFYLIKPFLFSMK